MHRWVVVVHNMIIHQFMFRHHSYALFCRNANHRISFSFSLLPPHFLSHIQIHSYQSQYMGFFVHHLRTQSPVLHLRKQAFDSTSYSHTYSYTDIYATLLQRSTDMKALQKIHAHMLLCGLDQNVTLRAILVDMYAKCESLDNARLIFNKTHKRGILLWNAMIKSLIRRGLCEEGLALYHQMQQEGIPPDNFTFLVVIKACAGLSVLHEGNKIFLHIIRAGYELDVSVGTAVLDMFAKCHRIADARHVFDKMPARDVVSWTAMISGYVRHGNAKEVLILFNQMQLEDVAPDSFTIISVLQACAHLGALKQGKGVHGYIIRSGFDLDAFVRTAVIDMYGKCACVKLAGQLFGRMSQRNVASWSAMISGYALNGHANEALALFGQMQLADVKPDSVIMRGVLQACARLRGLQEGKLIHGCIIKSGFDSDASVVTSIVDMYAKCRSIDIARHLFDRLAERNVVSWNAMIVGYAQNGRVNEAITLFQQMQSAEAIPDSVTLMTLLSACARSGYLQQGKWIHNYIIKGGFGLDVLVETALIDMYAKSGSIDVARQIFDKMCDRNVVSWSVMIAGYGMHGRGDQALALFYQMQQAGMKPDHITFICVLSACSHSGLVDEGWKWFDCMSQNYRITPRVKHYSCMVDLLGRAGHLHEAQDFIQKMPLEPNASVWASLLGACKIYCNVELGEQVAQHLFELEPENATYYILLSNIYAAAGRWDDVAKVRTMMKDMGLKKAPGCSSIEVNNMVYAFIVADRSHHRSETLYAMRETLIEQMKIATYVRNTTFVPHNVEAEMKEYRACCAIDFGLINISPGNPMWISKNLNVC